MPSSGAEVKSRNADVGTLILQHVIRIRVAVSAVDVAAVWNSSREFLNNRTVRLSQFVRMGDARAGIFGR
jgi:hypothetical protein